MRNIDRNPQKECQMMTEAEIGMKHLQTKKLRIAANARDQRKSWNRISLKAFRESMDLLIT